MNVANDLIKIRKIIEETCVKCGRSPSEVTLVAVSKKQAIESIIGVFNAGQCDFGENYVQELSQKHAAIAKKAAHLKWHFIGNLQRNKTKQLLPLISMFHTLDSLRLANTIQQQAANPLDTLIEVNIARESQKHGIAPDDVEKLLKDITDFDKINVVGLMCIPPANENPENSRPYFKALAALLRKINELGCYRKPLQHLSMGMSNDYKIAIQEGATIIRIGSALFGDRVS